MQSQTMERELLSAVLAASRAFSESLEAALAQGPDTGVGQLPSLELEELQPAGANAERIAWDPLTDDPLVAPKVEGTRREQDWCSLVYLAAIWLINIRYERGATKDEVREFALKAGYKDGRAVTAWSKGNGATRNDMEKQRWVTDLGRSLVVDLAERCNVLLPDELVRHASGR